MSDSDLRKILRGVIDDLETGRLRLRSPLRRVKGVLIPALMAAGLGLAGCDTNSVGNAHDGRADVENVADAAYMAPFLDAGLDAEVVVDADLDADVVDSGPNTLYMGPPPIEPEDPE